MGATRHYHPISLHVIRGAAEYCGWKFGKIVQHYSNERHGTASYQCRVVSMPRGAEEWPIKTIQKQLQHCFMDDITVSNVLMNSQGWMQIKLDVTLSGDFPEREAIKAAIARFDARSEDTAPIAR